MTAGSALRGLAARGNAAGMKLMLEKGLHPLVRQRACEKTLVSATTAGNPETAKLLLNDTTLTGYYQNMIAEKALSKAFEVQVQGAVTVLVQEGLAEHSKADFLCWKLGETFYFWQGQKPQEMLTAILQGLDVQTRRVLCQELLQEVSEIEEREAESGRVCSHPRSGGERAGQTRYL